MLLHAIQRSGEKHMDAGTIALVIIIGVAALSVLGWALQKFLDSKPFR